MKRSSLVSASSWRARLGVELHTLHDADAARRFYGGVLGMQKQVAPAGIDVVAGLGDAAYRNPTAMPGSATTLVTLTVLEGSTVVSVEVWSGGGTAVAHAIARSVANDIVPKLK